MVRFSFEDREGRICLGLGIARENVNRLIAGKPIVVRLAEMAPDLTVDGEILIFFGETEAEMTNNLAPFIDAETKVSIDPRMKSKMT